MHCFRENVSEAPRERIRNPERTYLKPRENVFELPRERIRRAERTYPSPTSLFPLSPFLFPLSTFSPIFLEVSEKVRNFVPEQAGLTAIFKFMSTQVMTQKLAEYFKTQPVLKAWLFGSYARGEETEDSDVDLLVAYDDNEDVSLFTIGGIYMDLRRILGREVDLVEEGTLRPWAATTVDRDRILIYEREGSRQGATAGYP